MKTYEIYERIYQFILSVLSLFREIPKTIENLVIIKQLARSVTSMGANAQEADGSESTNDFIHKFSIVRKEAKETKFWLRLLGDLHPGVKSKIEVLLTEIQEIINIVSAIIKKIKEKRAK